MICRGYVVDSTIPQPRKAPCVPTQWYFYRDGEGPLFELELAVLIDEGDCDLLHAIGAHGRLGRRILIDPDCPIDDMPLGARLRVLRVPGESVTYGAVYAFFQLQPEHDQLQAVGLVPYKSTHRRVPWHVRRQARARLRSWHRFLL
jgi:hypothetical protein